jgi:hypothetical protein
MADHFGRAGRRADLSRLLHTTLVRHGTTPLDGSARATIDARVAQVAAELGMSEAAALKRFDDRLVVALAVNTANAWHAQHVAAEVASGVLVEVPAADAGQLVMGLAMAVAQMVQQVYGELPASVGEPLDALCELGSALRRASVMADAPPATVTLQTLATAHRTIGVAADGVADGTVPVVLLDSERPQFATQLYEDARLARELQP